MIAMSAIEGKADIRGWAARNFQHGNVWLWVLWPDNKNGPPTPIKATETGSRW